MYRGRDYNVGARVSAGPFSLGTLPRALVVLLQAWAVLLMSADGVQHDHRDLALGLALIIGVGRPER